MSRSELSIFERKLGTMKSFKFKDLMISVGSVGAQSRRGVFCFPASNNGCWSPSHGCFDFTCYIHTIPTVQALLNCPRLSLYLACAPGTGVFPVPTDTPVINPVDYGVAREELAAVKVELEETLRQVEVQQRSLDESLQPKTVAEVEELQAKLREASSELERRKQELQNPAKTIAK